MDRITRPLAGIHATLPYRNRRSNHPVGERHRRPGGLANARQIWLLGFLDEKPEPDLARQLRLEQTDDPLLECRLERPSETVECSRHQSGIGRSLARCRLVIPAGDPAQNLGTVEIDQRARPAADRIARHDAYLDLAPLGRERKLPIIDQGKLLSRRIGHFNRHRKLTNQNRDESGLTVGLALQLCGLRLVIISLDDPELPALAEQNGVGDVSAVEFHILMGPELRIQSRMCPPRRPRTVFQKNLADRLVQRRLRRRIGVIVGRFHLVETRFGHRHASSSVPADRVVIKMGLIPPQALFRIPPKYHFRSGAEPDLHGSAVMRGTLHRVPLHRCLPPPNGACSFTKSMLFFTSWKKNV